MTGYICENKSVRLFLAHCTIGDSECRTLWGKREQAAFILATEERVRHQKLLNFTEMTIVVGSLWWHVVGTSVAGPMAIKVEGQRVTLINKASKGEFQCSILFNC